MLGDRYPKVRQPVRTYTKLPEHLASSTRSPEFLRLLDQDLTRLWELSRSTHQKVSERRTHVTPLTRNVYNPGELVLLQRDPAAFQPSKLKLPFTGSYEVIQHVGMPYAVGTSLLM
jgi:hypothetical protein